METLELVPTPLKQLQTRASFPEASPVLQEVQIADELGFAYLTGDIDFGAVGRDEIFQNIRFIILTEYFSTPLDREFGFDYSMIDKPMAIAEAIFAQEVALKISLYEPRAQFRSIDYVRDEMVGKLSPSVVVALLTTQELPPSLPYGGEATIASVPGGATVEETDLPFFYETMIALARVPGPVGPVGAKGDAATIEVGTTTTGAAGTSAMVVNIGDEHFAVFEFTIPKGDKGDQGTGITIKGTVPNSGALPPTGNQPGDMWIAADTGHGWTWNGTAWVDAGPIQGPVGPQGPQGVQGPKGDAATATAGTTATSAPGTNATVSNVGTLSAAIFNFTIPRGDVGSQGVQGVQGAKGDTGNTGATGPSNVLSVQSTATGAPGTNANVTIAGTSPAQTLAFTIPRGDVGATGSTGSQGVAGPPNVLSVQSTSTGAPGTNANVTIAGTSPAQTLAFTIPRGDVGSQGVQGPTGATGPPGTGQIWKGTWSAATSYVLNDAVEYQGSTYLAVGANINEPPTPASSNWIPPLANTAIRGSIAALPPSNQVDYYARGDNTWQSIKPVIWSVRNRNYNSIGNPNFEVDQIRVGALYSITAAGQFSLDRWWSNTLGSMRFSTQQVSSSPCIVVPGTNYNITSKFLRHTVTTQQSSLAASDYYALQQEIEGSLARELLNDVTSVSILARSSVANLKFSVTLQDTNNAFSITRLCTMGAANTWTLIQLPNWPAMWGQGSFLTDPGSIGYKFFVTLACGTNYLISPSNTWVAGNKLGLSGMDNFAASAVNSTFDLAFVQHEPGLDCTPLIDLPWNDNYEQCLRYFQKTWDYREALGAISGAAPFVCYVQQAWGGIWGGTKFVKRMATIPSVVPYNPVNGGVGARGWTAGGNYSCTVQGINESGWNSFSVSPATIANDFKLAFHYYADTRF